MKTSAFESAHYVLLAKGARKERDARGHRTALLPCLSLSALHSAIAVCSSPGTEIPGEKTLLFRWKGGGGEKEKERGKQRGRKENLSAFSVFAIFANVSFVMDHQGRSTMCIVRRIVLMYQRFASPSTSSKRTSLFCVSLSFSFSRVSLPSLLRPRQSCPLAKYKTILPVFYE